MMDKGKGQKNQTLSTKRVPSKGKVLFSNPLVCKLGK